MVSHPENNSLEGEPEREKLRREGRQGNAKYKSVHRMEKYQHSTFERDVRQLLKIWELIRSECK
jgi:hypothetical protein